PRRKQRPRGAPEATGMRAGVAAALVELDSSDEAGGVCGELDTELHRACILRCDDAWGRRAREEAAGAGAGSDGHSDSGGRRLEVATVVYGAALDRCASQALRAPGVAPRARDPGTRQIGLMPGAAAIEGDLDAGDHTATRIACRAGHRHLQ